MASTRHLRSVFSLVTGTVVVAGCQLPPIDYDGEGFTSHGALEIVARRTAEFDQTTEVTGVARLATADDVGTSGGPEAAVAAESFVVDDGVDPVLLSLHSVDASGDRRVLYLPVPGAELTVHLAQAGWFRTFAIVIEDDDGTAFAGTELINEPLPAEPAVVDAIADVVGDVDATDCGHRKETALMVACVTRTVLRVGESADTCGMTFTNHSTWAVEGDWGCTDSVDPVIWSAVRPNQAP